MMWMHAKPMKPLAPQQANTPIQAQGGPAGSENDAGAQAAFGHILNERKALVLKADVGHAAKSMRPDALPVDTAKQPIALAIEQPALDDASLVLILRQLELGNGVSRGSDPKPEEAHEEAPRQDAPTGPPVMLQLAALVQNHSDRAESEPPSDLQVLPQAAVPVEADLNENGLIDLSNIDLSKIDLSKRAASGSDSATAASQSAAAETAAQFDAALVVSTEVRTFPESSPHRIVLRSAAEIEQPAAISAPARIEPSVRHASQSLNVVLALPDADPLRCTVRNLGESLSISIATSDPSTMAYLRDNDHIVRANLERMGIQTDALQIKLSVSPSTPGQDPGNASQHSHQHSGYDGAHSGRQHREQEARQHQAPEQSQRRLHDDANQDHRSSASGRYL